MPRRYHQARVREHWQREWDAAEVFRLPADVQDPVYVLGMFPYTSGSIHMGHVRNYSITDAYARFRRMQGDEVLHPMGWDAFGLPAENAAHERDTDPATWTSACIDRMRSQLRDLGFGYDWSREVTTCEPAYYQWNQWLFKRFHEAGLVTYKAATVNWCPDCETVLADAQVEPPAGEDRSVQWNPGARAATVTGSCWRCGTDVTSRSMPQWFFRLTEYADDLHAGLDELDGWPAGVRETQRHWIGRREGAEITFELPTGRDLRVFSARPETVFGATFLAVSPTHPVVEAAVEATPDLAPDITAVRETGETTAGVKLDVTASHPLTGAELPVYAAAYVLPDVGTGAVMGVPAHNEQDHRFATAHDLPVSRVIEPADDAVPPELPNTGTGELVQSGEYTGLSTDAAADAITAESAIDGTVTFRLRDWLISRQRYWGTPIPIVHCDECGRVPVPDEDLPVELPDFRQVRGNPLAADESFVETTCPDCGRDARRETDTMDTFVDSSWYFLRYLSPDETDRPYDVDKANDTLPVDVYVGGEEHAVLHLLYLRFVARALTDLGFLEHPEPIERLVTQGTVLHSGQKMSKSVGNVVAPHEYGAETTRLFVLSAAHPTRDFEWTAKSVRQAYDLQETIYEAVETFDADTGHREAAAPRDRYLERELDRTITAVTEAFESFRFHTVVSELESLTDVLARYRATDVPSRYTLDRALRILARLVAPLAPYLGEELWTQLDETGLIATADWPAPLRPAPEYERDRALVERTRRDVREIVDVADIVDPTEIVITVAPPWKFAAHAAAREADDPDALFAVAADNGWTRGEDSDRREAYLSELAARIEELEPALSAEREAELLTQAGWLIETEFDASVTVTTAADDADTTAEPSRPAIQIRGPD